MPAATGLPPGGSALGQGAGSVASRYRGGGSLRGVENVRTIAGEVRLSEGLIPPIYLIPEHDKLVMQSLDPELRREAQRRAKERWRALPLRTRAKHHIRHHAASARSRLALRIAPWLRDDD